MIRTILAVALAAVLSMCSFPTPVLAADIKFSALPIAAAPTGAERLVAIQGTGCPTSVQPCSNVAITPAQLATYVASASPVVAAFQPKDADLTAIAALTTTSTGRDLLTSTDATAIRTKAGLGSIATQSASAVAITGGTITGVTNLAPLASPTFTGTVTMPALLVSTPSTPATSSAACTVGQVTWDASFIYVCVAASTWKRSALATW